jgi:Ca2+-binding RTX toxin-like protein
VATYAFETITADQAMNIQAGDRLTFAGAANRISVAFSPDRLPLPTRITVTLGDRTVEFGPELATVSQRGYALGTDGSVLRIGGSGVDLMGGWTWHDALYGGGGDDQMRGYDGHDLLQGNAGDDTLDGDQGSNTLYGGQGDDVLRVATAYETWGGFAHGNLGNDHIEGGGGGDTLLGGQGDDFIAGLDGNDYLSGDLGDDELHGGAGADTLLGGDGNDIIQTGGGADRALAGAGDDRIAIFYGGGAIVDGEAGNDTITSVSAGKDVLSGGAGRDVFEFVANTRPAQGQDDVILDWNGAEDSLRFQQVSIYALGETSRAILPREYSEFVAHDYAEALRVANEHIAYAGARYVAAQVGADVVIFAETNGDSSDGADASVVLVGRTLADIGLGNFI